MSIGKKNITSKRIDLLYKTGMTVFHAGDASSLWQIEDKHLLYVTLERYTKYGLIYRVYKGLYSLEKPEKIDPVLLGYKALHDYCYLSTETVLFEQNYISRKINAITFVSSNTKKIRILDKFYISRQMDDKFLYNPAGITTNNNIPTASVERAIADMLYYNPSFHFDRQPDWKKVRKIQEEISYPLTLKRYDSA